MDKKKLRIGVVVDYIVSEYNESLIKGAAQCCKDNDIELLIFEIGGILKTCKNFEYQRMSISAHIKKNNLDGIVFTSGTQVHEITQDDFVSYLKSYKSIPIVNISNVIPGIPSVVVDCDEAYEALIEYIITKQESRKIAVMGVSSNSHEVENRTRIIKKVLADHKIPEEDCCFWKSNFEYSETYEMLEPFEYFNLPARAVLITAFDEATGLDVSINPTPIIFNPKESILPKDCFTFDSDGCIIEAIYHNTIQYGYIVLKKQDFDLPVYDIVSRAVSSQMAFCFNYLKLVNEQSMIKDRYKKMDLMAHTDELTGLSNRRGFMELGVTTMNFAQNIDGNGLVLYCDMNGLKKINDTYGHETGDAAIQAQGEILKSNFRSNDIVARLGGDEFAVICPGLKPDRLAVIKQNIDANCRNWEVENEVPFELSICFGSVEYPHPEAGYILDELLSIADKDLYNVKAKYKAFKAANK